MVYGRTTRPVGTVRSSPRAALSVFEGWLSFPTGPLPCPRALPACTSNSPVMRLRLIRSAWGLGQLRSAPEATLAAVRVAGFEGIEASLRDLGKSVEERAHVLDLARREGLSVVLSAYSSWADYEGPADEQLAKTPEQHLSAFKEELEQVKRTHAPPTPKCRSRRALS